jgi:hypothetical protein
MFLFSGSKHAKFGADWFLYSQATRAFTVSNLYISLLIFELMEYGG